MCKKTKINEFIHSAFLNMNIEVNEIKEKY